MYIEDKSKGLIGPAGIGSSHLFENREVTYYRGREFASLLGTGIKANFLGFGCFGPSPIFFANIFIDLNYVCIKRIGPTAKWDSL